jgi:formylglycine-generating enzyme required for sulfatase activity
MLPRTALALALLLPAAASAQELDMAVSAVVRISGTRGGTPVRGTGFVVGLDRAKATIVTASHVIAGVQGLEATFAVDRTVVFPAEIVLGMESGNERGLAVFQVRGALPAGVSTLTFDTDLKPQRGEDLFLVGFPQMATAPITLRRAFAGLDGNFFQLDLPAGEGFSGAPVLRRGKVVGVVVAEDQQITFAIKALVARDAVIGWGATLGAKQEMRSSDGEQHSAQNKTPATSTATDPRREVALRNLQAMLDAFNDSGCVPGEQRTQAGIVFVRICGGTFTMGSASTDRKARANEKPAHQVTLSEYWIGKTEVTNEQYRSFRPDHAGEATLPATMVSWTDAKAACENFGARLPTEAEWEYAARAGSQSAWSSGDNENMLREYAWFGESPDKAPHPVGTKKANLWGVHDMHGNVFEWVADWYGTYSSVAQTDPSGPATGKARVMRGGDYMSVPIDMRSAFRVDDAPSYRTWYVGFRCALGLRRQP